MCAVLFDFEGTHTSHDSRAELSSHTVDIHRCTVYTAFAFWALVTTRTYAT